jgi:Alpha-acetolactate decarboxylase
MTAFDPVEIFQTSTMAALLDGVYEVNVSIRELLRHGDFGLGTFNSLDGEMLVLDGVCHQLRADGSATTAWLDELTPFAAVTWFRADRTIEVPEPCDRAALKRLINESLDNINLMVAVRVVGEFSAMRTRTVTRQPCPYRPFTEATHDQQEGDVHGCGRDAGRLPHARLSAGHHGRGLPLALHRQGPSPRRACTGLPAGPGNGRHECQLGFAPELAAHTAIRPRRLGRRGC